MQSVGMSAANRTTDRSLTTRRIDESESWLEIRLTDSLQPPQRLRSMDTEYPHAVYMPGPQRVRPLPPG